MSTGNRAPLRVVLFTGASADETTSQPIDVSGYTQLVMFQKGTGTVSSGVITIEEADYGPTDMPYGGTWSSVTTLDPTQVSGGAQQAYHFSSNRAYGVVRGRISPAIGGGGSVELVLRAV